jgi:multidrug resistance efflux pump
MSDTAQSMPKAEETIHKEAKALERKILMLAAAIILVIGGAIAAVAYLGVENSRIYIEKSQISAPEVALAPTVPGVLRAVYVSEGQEIAANTVVAQVGDELIKSTAGGLVISASKDIGKNVAPGTAVVSTINPAELRVVGRLDEDKGLKDIKVGDRASFTVDAFGGKQYDGVVSEVSPTSRESDIVFSISDKREVRQFDVKVYFDESKYPELKNGMSARIWVFKN